MFKKSQTFQCVCLMYLLLFARPAHLQEEQNSYSTTQLQHLAEVHVQNAAHISDDQELKVQSLELDSRIGTRVCAHTPNASTADAPPFNRQVAVQIKCESPKIWTQYVHVRINKLSEVVVAKDTIARGQIIHAQDLTTQMRPQHFIRSQYIEDPDLIIGSRSKRALRVGLPISMNQLCMVCKGDSVNIIASVNGLTIKTTGEALEDGGIGQSIRVRNRKSGRLVTGRVTGVETVAVNI